MRTAILYALSAAAIAAADGPAPYAVARAGEPSQAPETAGRVAGLPPAPVRSAAPAPSPAAAVVPRPSGLGGATVAEPAGSVPTAAARSAVAGCAEVARPREVGWELLPPPEPLGPIEVTGVDGFTDDYLYSPGGGFKIGTRREWGSTIVFYGRSGFEPGFNQTNAIDANDTGREVQVALYDTERLRQGCAWDASCLSHPEAACGAEITFLGWNPVQGGNECNQGGVTEAVLHEPGRLESIVRPLFWNPDWSAPDCRNDACANGTAEQMLADVRYRQRLRFVADHVVEMWMEYTNLSAVDHPRMHQEFPTVYTSFGDYGPDLRVILDSEGNRITVDQPANDGFFTRFFHSPGGFAALQDGELDYGVGLYHENDLEFFHAWQLLGRFNNVRARFEFGLPGHGRVRGRAYLILGGYDTIRQTAAWLDAKLPPFGELESPRAEAAVGGQLRLSGWVLDNRGVSRLEVLLDGRRVAVVEPAQPRPDVCTLWPGYAACARAGFELSLDLEGVSRCPHRLVVRATDSDGNRRTIARRRIFVGETAPCQGSDCGTGPATHPVYRFSWSRNGDADHSFSRSPEAAPDYELEGVGFRAFEEFGSGLVALWQTYCAECTDHLQTTDAREGLGAYSDAVLLGYCSKNRSPAAPRELRRLWSESRTDHFVSADPNEWQAAAASGYILEGGCWVP